jgi:cell division septum initiation protein DivIVA
MSASQRQDLPKSQRQLRAETAERLEAIVEAAERAAESVIDDAEEQARRYLAQAKAEADRVAGGRLSDLSGLIDALLAQAASLRREAERLQASLEAARAELSAEDSPPAGEPERAQEPLEAEQPLRRPPRLRAVAGERASEPDADRADPAGARLLATQMAVSGSSRQEIETRLRNGFQIEDTSAILDAILGPED